MLVQAEEQDRRTPSDIANIFVRAGDDTTLVPLGALVFVTTVVSGIDYVVTYTRKAVAASRQQRGLA